MMDDRELCKRLSRLESRINTLHLDVCNLLSELNKEGGGG